MRPFNYEKAKAGEPVQTADGRKARIICFDANSVYKVVALVENGGYEEVVSFDYWGNSARSQKLKMEPKEIDVFTVIYVDERDNVRSSRTVHYSQEHAEKYATNCIQCKNYIINKSKLFV